MKIWSILRSTSARENPSGDSITSVSIPTSTPPFNSAPHTSNVAASKLMFDACATRSPARTCR